MISADNLLPLVAEICSELHPKHDFKNSISLDSALDTDIDPYDNRAHQHKPIKPQSQRHTERYGVLEKCTWSENASRQLSVPERLNFTEFLRSKEIQLK